MPVLSLLPIGTESGKEKYHKNNKLIKALNKNVNFAKNTYQKTILIFLTYMPVKNENLGVKK